MGTDVVKVIFNKIGKLFRLQTNLTQMRASSLVYWYAYLSLVFWRKGTCQAEYFVASWWACLQNHFWDIKSKFSVGEGVYFVGGRSAWTWNHAFLSSAEVVKAWRHTSAVSAFTARYFFLGTGATLHLCQLVKKYSSFCETRRFIYLI
jgi:hypothetical protein